MRSDSLLVFGDVGKDWLAQFKTLLNEPSAGLSGSFRQEAGEVVRTEVAKDSALFKSRIWNFVTLHELADTLEKEQTHCPPAFVYSITTFSQIYSVLNYVQRHREHFLDLRIATPVGHGIGLLSASVFACADDAPSAAELGVQAIRLSFRLGLLAQRKLDSVTSGRSQGLSVSPWSSLKLPYGEIEAEHLVSEFNARVGVAKQKTCFVSLVAESYTLVCGPTSTLHTFRREINISETVEACLSLSGASHLYSESDVVDLDSLLSTFNTLRRQIRAGSLLSSVSGTSYVASTPSDIFRHSIVEFLTGKTAYIALCHGVARECRSENCCLFVAGGEQFSRLLVNQIQEHQSNIDLHLVDVYASKLDTLGSIQDSKPAIAIVGMSGRFPGAGDIQEFWELLQAGKDVHRTIPPERFNVESHTDPTGQRKNTSKTPFGCFIDNPGLFDPRFFNMSPKEAAQTDPAQRLMIMTAFEALEMSGFVPNRTLSSREDRVSTFYGQASDDWREVNSSQDIDTYFIPGGIRAFGPGRINYHLKFSGPSYSIDTACSSSFAALHMACNSLWARDCDTAITGGANILTNPDIFAGLSRGHFLSQTGSCKTFDHDADGYCRADGVGSVVLKRLEDAEADNDNVLGVILGIGTNHSAHAVSITHPHSATQSSLYRSVLANSRVDAHDVDYIEMHGTGTQAGDFNETKSVSDVFASIDQPRRKQPLHMGSVKANIGHGEAAAGIMSLIKVLLMLRHNAIPPHVGVKGEVNKTLPHDLKSRNIHIPFSGAKWSPKANTSSRIAFLNNFSAAGGNTALVLREHVPKTSVVRKRDPRDVFPIVISARTIRSLRMIIKRLSNFLTENRETSIASLSYTLTARRTGHPFRKTFIATDVDQVKQLLGKALEEDCAPVPNYPPGVVFMFTGQGSMYTALAQSLFQSCKSFRTDIFDFDSISKSQGFPSFLSLIESSEIDLLTLPTALLQVGHVCIQLALARLWISLGTTPKAVIGHSLGEYAALAIAGVLSPSDMIYLVGRRAQLLEQYCRPRSHGMLAVNANRDVLTDESAGISIELSCINGPAMTVFGGLREELDKFSLHLKSKGYKCVSLETNYAFHTSQVEPILTDLAVAAGAVSISRPSIPVLSPLLGRVIRSESNALNAEYFCRHTREPVDFHAVLSTFRDSAEWTMNTVWLEIGPQPTCVKFAEAVLGRNIKSAASLSRGVDSWKTLSSATCALYSYGIDIDWFEFHKDFENCHQLLELPSYSFDLKNYWIDYVHDWCLHKGQTAPNNLLQSSNSHGKPRLSTTSIQKIIEEKIEPGKASILVESDFTEPMLERLATGHRVHGVSLCPSSLYADMAITIAKYLYGSMFPDKANPIFDVCNMTVGKPFIIDHKHSVLFRISTSADESGMKLRYYTARKDDESKITEHATCQVQYANGDKLLSKWNRNSYLIKERMSALETSAVTGSADRIQRNLVYRLFSSFVDYAKDYQGIEEVIVDSDRFEARAKVSLKPTEPGTSFALAPTWIDSFCHLTGVILNATNSLTSAEYVYISHGWKSIRILGEPTTGKLYQTYTRMQETEESFMEGDVWIFDGDNVVGLAKGITFQRIPRKVINVLLPSQGIEATSGAGVRSSAGKSPTTPISPTNLQQRGPSVKLELPDQQVTITKSASAPNTPTPHVVGAVLQVISEECGVDPSELVDGCTFTSLGIDSLLSLEILAKLRESIGMDLRPHIFLENETIGNLKMHLVQTSLGQEPGCTEPRPFQQEVPTISVPHPDNVSVSSHSSDEFLGDDLSTGNARLRRTSSTTSFASDVVVTHEDERSNPRATSYLLSGNPAKATKTLFLFPDGSGSATSYATIPPLGSDMCVYGLNCPFMTSPERWKNGISGVTTLYLEEIRRRQPNGPYNIGGWSAGGVLAYEATKQIIHAGDVVDRLILIDSPCPVNLAPMPIKMFKYLDSIKLLGSGNAGGSPTWLIPHFEATVANLDGYRPAPIPSRTLPNTTAIWARRGVTSVTGGKRPLREPGDPDIMEWLLEDRSDFGCNGWDMLIAAESINCEVMSGHHFSMTNENVNELGDLIGKAMR